MRKEKLGKLFMMENLIMPITVTILFLFMTISSFSYGVLRKKDEVKKLRDTLINILEDPKAYQNARNSHLVNKG